MTYTVTVHPAAYVNLNGDADTTGGGGSHVRVTWFEQIAAGTSGTITVPTGGTIVLDSFAGGVDCLVATMENSWPTFDSPVTAGGAVVAGTLDGAGNYTISGTPSAYPVALIYQYRVALSDLDDTKMMGATSAESYQDLGKGSFPTFIGVKLNGAAQFQKIGTPANPPTGYVSTYFKSDDKLYRLTSGGVETEVGGGGSGDMLKSVYDPANKNANAFDVDNHVSGTTNKVFTAANQTKLAGISGTNTGDQTSIVGISGTKAQFNTALSDGDFMFAGEGGSGDVVGPAGATSGNLPVFADATGKILSDSGAAPSDFQEVLVSGTNIKTINGSSILGGGNLSVGAAIGNGVTGGASGSVLYVDDLLNLAQENATFFYNPTQNQLGVGANTFLADGNKLNCIGSTNGVIQTNCQNQSNGTSASSDLVATADTGSDTANFVDVGINSSTYNDAAYSIGGALSGYLLANGGDLTIGTATTTKVIKYHTGGTTSDKLRLTISDTRATYTVDVATPNVLFGFTTTATSAGTTTLTATSNHQQFFTGTSTHTVILPNATTLNLGHQFEIHNNSTGAITVQTNGGATLLVAAPKTDTEVTCTSIGTAAGTWDWFYAATDGINTSEQAIIISGNNTLTSQTAAQPLFDSVGAGALTVDQSTLYAFECEFALASLSASSGSFGFAIGGTATLTSIAWSSTAGKVATLATAGTIQGTRNATNANTALVTANTSVTGYAKIRGVIRTNAAGTIIPQVSLTVAAAAVVQANSFFRIWKLGTSTQQTIGSWS